MLGEGHLRLGEGELEALGSALSWPESLLSVQGLLCPSPPRPEVPPGCASSCVSQWLPPPRLLGSGQLAGSLFSFASAAKRLLCLTVQLQPPSFSRWEAGPFLGGCRELSGDEGRSGARHTGSPRLVPPADLAGWSPQC